MAALLMDGRKLTAAYRRRLTALLEEWRRDRRLWIWGQWAQLHRAMGYRAGLLGDAGTLATLR